MDTCKDCEFYEKINGCGRCKVDSPHLNPVHEGMAEWPIVRGDEKACGKFARK